MNNDGFFTQLESHAVWSRQLKRKQGELDRANDQIETYIRREIRTMVSTLQNNIEMNKRMLGYYQDALCTHTDTEDSYAGGVFTRCCAVCDKVLEQHGSPP